ncbi:MAG TPA: hypothetical protein VGX92_10865 [Pyrinomonadaceae bacterium]|jgi:hypothetical protein|nr:hypothetical protein [Pyrinomonadaceae bacterium]
MNTNHRIKIIKRVERERQREAAVAKRLASAAHIARGKALDAAMTIKGWVGEMRQRKQQSTVTTPRFESLFEETA